MILGAAAALLLVAAPALDPAAAPDPAGVAATQVTGRDVHELESTDPDARFHARLVLWWLRPGGEAVAGDVARGLLPSEEVDAGGLPVAVLVLDRRRHRAGIAASPVLAGALDSGGVRQTLRDVEEDLARGTFDRHVDRAALALGSALADAAPDAGAGPAPPAAGGAPGPASVAPAAEAPRAEDPAAEPDDPPLEPLWSTGPRWLFGLVAGVVALLLWATGTPVVRGRDWALAVVRSVIPIFVAAVGTRILFGPGVALVFGASLAAALFLARLALGPARRREDARAPGPVGWLGEVVFAIASQLLVIAVQVVVDILISALLEAIFGGGGSGGASWGGGGGAFSGGGASGSW